MTRLLLIALAGGIGAVSRYLIAGGVQRLGGTSWPIGTFAVNIIGCFILGFFGVTFSRYVLLREEYRIALLVGGLGAFTTFSTYGWETFSLLNDGQRWPAVANVLLSTGIGIGAVWLGYRLAEKMYGA